MGFHISSKVFQRDLRDYYNLYNIELSSLNFISCDYLEHLPSMFKLFNSNGTFVALEQIPVIRIADVRNKTTRSHCWLRTKRDFLAYLAHRRGKGST